MVFVINGEKVSEDWFTPGWTNYNKRVPYQVYDVTNILETGENALAVILSYGWYAGYVGYAQLVKLPQVKDIYSTGLHYILPIVVLIWFLMVERQSPARSAFFATSSRVSTPFRFSAGR